MKTAEKEFFEELAEERNLNPESREFVQDAVDVPYLNNNDMWDLVHLVDIGHLSAAKIIAGISGDDCDSRTLRHELCEAVWDGISDEMLVVLTSTKKGEYGLTEYKVRPLVNALLDGINLDVVKQIAETPKTISDTKDDIRNAYSNDEQASKWAEYRYRMQHGTPATYGGPKDYFRHVLPKTKQALVNGASASDIAKVTTAKNIGAVYEQLDALVG